MIGINAHLTTTTLERVWHVWVEFFPSTDINRSNTDAQDEAA